MEAKAYIKNIRISPKKLRFLLQEIKKAKPADVLHSLEYSPKKGAKIFYNAIKSALTNAKNNLKVDEESLVFKTLTVEEGRKLKRYRPGARGTAKPYGKRYSHIKVILKVQEPKKEIKQNVKSSEDKK